jgi:hypothetical protein
LHGLRTRYGLTSVRSYPNERLLIFLFNLMPKIAARDGTRLYVEEVGAGTPVVFVHEYAGDYRSWEPQIFLCRQPPLRNIQPANAALADLFSAAEAGLARP